MILVATALLTGMNELLMLGTRTGPYSGCMHCEGRVAIGEAWPRTGP